MMRIGLAQINTTVGDFDGNMNRITEVAAEAASLGVDLLVYPELAVCGYPPEDLLFKKSFIDANRSYTDKCASAIKGPTAIIGFVDSNENGLYNAAAIVNDGEVAAVYRKVCLPNYGVFDEKRYFKPGDEYPIFQTCGISFGITICEDIWVEEGPVARLARSGVELVVNISASPYHFGKGKFRERMMGNRADANKVCVAFCNLVGGQDELVFDGGSMVLDKRGHVLAKGRLFTEELIVVDIDSPKKRSGPSKFSKPADMGLEEEVYQALVLGTRDYVHKNGFKKVAIGLSGGIDSSLVAAIATEALGKENVIGVAMPSRYSSDASLTDAKALAQNLGIGFLTLPIEISFSSYLSTLSESFSDTEPDVTEQNLQARIRGNLLMALSNKFGLLVLATGNKSEMATGYTTLYGDLCGGYAVIKDVPKTMVYKLAEYVNSLSGSPVIPRNVLIKPPSAELAPQQKDTDSLPPYDQLDPILTAYIEEDESIESIIGSGQDEAMVWMVAKLVDRSEYKRRQAPPGIKITPKAFGRDRRMPITNRFSRMV